MNSTPAQSLSVVMYADDPPNDFRENASRWLDVGHAPSRRSRVILLISLLGLFALIAVLAIFNLVLQRKVNTKTARLNELVAALSRSEENYRSLVDNINVGICRIVAKGEGQIVQTNKAFAKMMGYSAVDEVMRVPAIQFYADPSEHEQSLKQIHETGAYKNEEIRARKKDGTELWVSKSSQAKFDEQGKLAWVDCIIMDVTERKKAEEALRTAHEYQKAVFDSINDALMIYDAKTDRIVEVNKRLTELYGYSHDEAMGMEGVQFSLGSEPYTQKNVLEWFRKAREEGPQVFEWMARHRSGRTFWVEASMRYAVIDHQELFLVAVRDISERKRAEEERLNYERQLQQTQKLESLGVLAGGIAHDFNNLLTVILGNLHLTLARMPATEPAREHIVEIEKATHRAADLAKQMLTYSGKGRFVAQPLDLREIAKDITHILQASISKKAELRFEGQEKLPLIQGDPAQIRQVVMNLVINASEALGDRPGMIEILTGTEEYSNGHPVITRNNEPLAPGLYVYLEVKDTGSGIDEKNLSKIFDPFFTTKFTGRGLGLAAVMGEVGGHKGGIEVDSQPGKGTSMRVLFPALEQPQRKTAVETKAASSWKGHGIVLLVDDEAAVLTITKKLLEFLGFQVLTAVDGLEAVNVFRAHSDEVLCVLLDLTMPRMDGQEASQEMKRIQPDVCVVICSGYSEQDVIRRFEGQAVAGFLQKPFSLDALRNMLQRISELSSADAEARKRRMK